MSSTRATLELVKEQMERDAQNRLDAAEEKHRKQLGAHKYSSLECHAHPSLLHWVTSAAGVMCVYVCVICDKKQTPHLAIYHSDLTPLQNQSVELQYMEKYCAAHRLFNYVLTLPLITLVNAPI